MTVTKLMPVYPAYAVITKPRMGERQFIGLLVALCWGVRDIFDHYVEDESLTLAAKEARTYALEALAHQIACLMAQRYDTGVETTLVFNELSLDKDLTEGHLRQRVATLILHLNPEEV